MILRELIARLEAVQDKERVCAFGFRGGHSYRGDSSQLAFTPARDVAVASMLADASAAYGATFDGWKGGEYTMGTWTDVYLAEPGDCGELMVEATLAHMLGECRPHAEALAAEYERGKRDGRAKAVAEERERCAKVAEQCACAGVSREWDAAQRAIVKAIRRGT